jgi:4-hydroxybenzoate polyprenyltransferase
VKIWSLWLRQCWTEARPVVQIIFALRFIAGALLCTTAPPYGEVALGGAGWVLATIAVYLYNGVADHAEDVANGSTRPIASGKLPPPVALLVAAAAAVLGCLLAAQVDLRFLLALCCFAVVGYVYSGPPFPLKRLYYTASVGGGFLGLLTYLGGALSTGRTPTAPVIVFAVLMSSWMGGVGGIAKDLSDVAGDRAAGRRTWPVVFGERRARRLLVAAAFAVALAFAVTAGVYATRLWGCAAAVCVGAAAISAACVRARHGANRARSRAPYRAFMWTQYASHAVLACVILVPLGRS